MIKFVSLNINNQNMFINLELLFRMQTCVEIVYKLLHIPCVQRHNYVAALASFPEVKREEADR